MFYTFDGIDNARDLSGPERADGARLRKDILIRSGELGKAADEDIRRLEALGLWAVADFRDASELVRRPDRIVPGAAYHHFQALSLKKVFSKPENAPDLAAPDVRREFRHIYVHLATMSESHEAYRQFFRLLLEAEGRPVLWHCTQGKDRTGAAAMLLLAALGFDENYILGEYMLTNQYMGAALEQKRADGATDGEMALLRELMLVSVDNGKNYLRILETEYGSIPNYLELVLGIGPDETARLEKYYLE